MGRKTCLKQLLKYAPRSIDKPELTQAVTFDNGIMKTTSLDVDTGTRTYDVDYEVVEDEPKDAPKNVDTKTGEIIEDDFFGDDFEPVKDDK